MQTTDYNDTGIVNKYSKKPLAAVYVNYPAMLKAAGKLAGKTLLDLGCGAGWLSHELSKKGARVFAVDNSSKWIDICRAQYAEGEKLKFFLADGDDLVDFKKGQFDVVTANMVFLNVPDARKIDRMFGEVSRVLKTGGQFIFSDCHPLMMVAAKVDTRVGAPPKDFHYFKDGVQHKLKCLLTDYSTIEFRDSHWSLGFYSTVLKKNGMMIEEIVEPKPYKLDPRKRLKDYRTPEYIIFKCRKVLGGIVSVR